MLCVHLHVLCAHLVFLRKIDFYVAYVKMKKIATKIILLESLLVFFIAHKKCLFFTKLSMST
jgi:hypothetical protein